MKKPREVIQQVVDAVANWPAFAVQAQIPEKKQRSIAATHRLQIFKVTEGTQ